MSQDFLHPDGTAETPGVPELSWRHRLCADTRAIFSRFFGLFHIPGRSVAPPVNSRLHVRSTVERPTGVEQQLSAQCYLGSAVWKVFLSRFVALAFRPRYFAPIIVDCWLLIQSTWSGRQSGPDFVYPLLGIRKRQSGRLAKLILEHSRDQVLYEHRATATFPQGIQPPCVAVIDLDEVARGVTGNRYSARVDIHGLVCMLMLIEVTITLVLHVFYLSPGNKGLYILVNWALGFALLSGWFRATLRLATGTLALARRSDTSTPGCAVLLDQDLTLILNGNHGVIEAIAESGFNLSYNVASRPGIGGEVHSLDSFYNTLEALCEGACLTILVLFSLLFSPPLPVISGVLLLLALLISAVVLWSARRLGAVHVWSRFRRAGSLIFPFLCILGWYAQIVVAIPFSTLAWHLASFVFSTSLLLFFLSGYRSQDFPIRSAKFLDALGHPRVRKWQFDTLAAAATFQCLVICRGIARPIKNIDVLALLDTLIPDQRDIWRVWKERVADRIVHETEISFAPTIPMFGDEQQRQLKDLLDQAQLGYDAYGHFYEWRVPSDAAHDVAPRSSIFGGIWSAIRRLFSSASSADRSRAFP